MRERESRNRARIERADRIETSRDRVVGNGFDSSGFPGIQCIRPGPGLGCCRTTTGEREISKKMMQDDQGCTAGAWVGCGSAAAGGPGALVP